MSFREYLDLIKGLETGPGLQICTEEVSDETLEIIEKVVDGLKQMRERRASKT